MNNLDEFKAGQVAIGNTDLAAALMACGVEPLDTPVSNTYTRDRPHRPGQPGIVQYHLKARSATFGTHAEKLVQAWDKGDANERLDAAIERIEDAELRAEIQALLPCAVMAFLRAGLQTRDIIRKWWRNVEPWMRIVRGKKSFIVPMNDKARKTWNL